MNSRLAAIYVDNFINTTSHCTTGDAKLIPVIIPDCKNLKDCKMLFDKAFELKKMVAKCIFKEEDVEYELREVERHIDNLFNSIYMI